MVNLTINNRPVCVPEGTTILEAAETVGIKIPTLCYLKGINDIGACRICVVEIEGKEALVSSCNTAVVEGISVQTNSRKAQIARKMNIDFILSHHDVRCPACVRSGNCSLQTLANEMNTGDLHIDLEETYEHRSWPSDFPMLRDSSKCIKCMRCVQICEKIQGLNVWDLAGTGQRSSVNVANQKKITDADCALCGQCITHCPTGALRERDDVDRFMRAVTDPEKVVVVQIAPAVRAAWGEGLGLPRELATEKRMVAAVRSLGVDYVFDTNFSADLTIMEEANEFLERMKEPEKYAWPMFTSCCPGWVRFVKSQYPDLVQNLSTAKSPQQMFGAVTKSYFARLIGVEPENIFCASIMPCVAKKHECAIPGMDDAGAGPDVDLSLTTRELDRLLKAELVIPEALPEEEFDSPLGTGSGAGVIFGATGGVMEAALRTAYFALNGENPEPDAFAAVRGLDGIKEAELEIAGVKVRAAIAHGLGNTRRLIERIRSGEAQYHFVEIMACPGGCAGGGGQPIHDGQELAGERGQNLYQLDRANELRFSHENPDVQTMYKDYFIKPLSEVSHKLLHTDHNMWKMPNER